MQQNATSVPDTLSSGNVVSTLTTLHLALIVLLAAIVVAGIVYGMRASRHRKRAERQVHEHVEQARVDTARADEPPNPASTTARVAPPPPPPPGAAPAPSAAPISAPPAAPAPAGAPEAVGAGPADGPVTPLKGLGPKVASRLGDLGITRVGQIAALDHDAAQALDRQLGAFAGRMERDRWVEQARFLAAGDVKGFEAVFGKL